MAQEFTIKSPDIEDKINQLLPSQGGFQPGVDFSASTMVIPIVDLTETAEGSSLRQDLQTSLSLISVTSHSIANTTTTMVNTTGYYRVFGTISDFTSSSGNSCAIQITDGTTTKVVYTGKASNSTANGVGDFDFVVLLQAGDTLEGTTTSAGLRINAVTRQIADLQGNLINP